MILNPNDWSRKTQEVLFGIALALAIVCMMGAGVLWSQGKMAWPLGVGFVVCAGAASYLAYDIWWKKHACKNKDGKTCSSLNRGCPDPTIDKDECGKCVDEYTPKTVPRSAYRCRVLPLQPPIKIRARPKIRVSKRCRHASSDAGRCLVAECLPLCDQRLHVGVELLLFFVPPAPLGVGAGGRPGGVGRVPSSACPGRHIARVARVAR